MGNRELKCLIWDLDNTLWQGTLLEGDAVELSPGIRSVIETLDARGILQSVASRNDQAAALAQLEHFGLGHYFLYPQINWGPKSVSVGTIIEKLNVGADTVAFVDDQAFERGEVASALPAVTCIDPAAIPDLLSMPEFNPRFVTVDSAQRRSMYQAEIERERVEALMPPDEFLETLGLVFTISEAESADLHRLAELTVRTNQLNSTGNTYTMEELEGFLDSDDHLLLIAGLDDAYGTYGKVGMALVEQAASTWHLRLLLMSCRVMSRGVGKVLLTHVLNLAAAAGKNVLADFVRTDRNRMMYLTFKLAGFREIDREGNRATLQHELDVIDPFPDHVVIRVA